MEKDTENHRHVCRVGDDQTLTKARFDACCAKSGGTGIARNLADEKLVESCDKYTGYSVGR